MKFCFAAIPGHGHTFPLVPLAAAAQAAGHDVLFLSRDDFAGRLPVPVIGGVPADLTLTRPSGRRSPRPPTAATRSGSRGPCSAR